MTQTPVWHHTPFGSVLLAAGDKSDEAESRENDNVLKPLGRGAERLEEGKVWCKNDKTNKPKQKMDDVLIIVNPLLIITIN